MPAVNSLAGMAKMFGMEYETLISGLIAVGILNQSGAPKKKLVDEGFFYPDGSIANYPRLKDLIQAMLGL